MIMAADLQPHEKLGNPYLLIVSFTYDARADGLPAQYNRVIDKENAVMKKAVQEGAVHLGHVLGHGKLLVAFCSNKAIEGPIAIKTGFLKNESLPVHSRHDPDWIWFSHEMESTPDEALAAKYEQLFSTLKRNGDNASIERCVDFAALFPKPELRDQFVQTVQSEGYVLSSQGCWESTKPPVQYWCELNFHTSVERDAILPRCRYLTEQAEAFGGEFDGWSTPVMS